MTLQKLFRTLHSADLVIMAYGVLLSILNIVVGDRIPNWWLMVLINSSNMR